MPLYEYQCDACGHRFERIQQKYSDAPIDVCPSCGKGPVQKLVSSPAFQFKGSGWYATDYARKSESAKSSESDSGGKDSEKTASSESKDTKESSKDSGSKDSAPSSTSAPKDSGPPASKT